MQRKNVQTLGGGNMSRNKIIHRIKDVKIAENQVKLIVKVSNIDVDDFDSYLIDDIIEILEERMGLQSYDCDIQFEDATLSFIILFNLSKKNC